MIKPVIICGGSGTRLQPLSTPECPKQFLPLINKYSLLQNTIQRLMGIDDLASPIVVGNIRHKALLQEHLEAIGYKDSTIILEPVGKNTAPAIAVAALAALEEMVDPLLLVLPADHAIADILALYEAISIARHYANLGKLVTFGVKPTAPETGYGYIKVGSVLDLVKAYKIAEFVEKPELTLAQKYVADGSYFWNSGMLMFTANSMIEEFKTYAANILLTAKNSLEQASIEKNIIHLSKNQFSRCENNSIDYAIMEKTAQGIMVEFDGGWSDLGSWSRLLEYQERYRGV
jgi:mannose-1-phosphate guanylyltransferase/mannose-6-phosphate isomerase